MNDLLNIEPSEARRVACMPKLLRMQALQSMAPDDLAQLTAIIWIGRQDGDLPKDLPLLLEHARVHARDKSAIVGYLNSKPLERYLPAGLRLLGIEG